MVNYKKGYYNSAKAGLIQLFEDKKIRGKKKARVIHHLGMIEYKRRNNAKAIFYFSRLYTKYPKSNFNEEGLLYLAKSFLRQKETAKAKSSIEEMMKKFPKSKHTKEAKKILSGL